mmetsp:Transcript_42797/g.81675  ORF Transcript_42797/g.81675 Transcript_42797/m.81675 type:complete len:583 (-) Transcript_42797:224-1972(-)
MGCETGTSNRTQRQGVHEPLLIPSGSHEHSHEDNQGTHHVSHAQPLRSPHSPGKFQFSHVSIDEHEAQSDLSAAEGLLGRTTSTGDAGFRFSWRKLWAFTGPGIIMSVAFFDPGNLESDLQMGSSTGYQLMWVLGWSTAVGLLFQLLAARIGVVTGRDLAEVLGRSLPDHARILVWFLIECAIIGSDIQEVIGCAVAIEVLSNGKVPLWAGTLLTGLDSFVFLLLEGAGIRWLEAFFAFLVATMAVTFGAMCVEASPPADKIMQGLIVPSLGPSTIKSAAGMIGAVIMPHNLFLHSSLVKTREFDRSHNSAVREANVYFALESTISLVTGFFINLSVVAVAAEGFRNMTDAESIGLSSAAGYLASSGHYSSYVAYVWGVGLLAAGQSSTMTGTYAGQFVMQGFLALELRPWQRIVITRCVALGPALMVACYATSGPGLDGASDWLNVLQSVQLPFAMLPVTILSSSSKLMGVHANGIHTQVVCALLNLLLLLVNFFLLIESVMHSSSFVLTLFTAGAIAYLCLLSYISCLLMVAHEITIVGPFLEQFHVFKHCRYNPKPPSPPSTPRTPTSLLTTVDNPIVS